MIGGEMTQELKIPKMLHFIWLGSPMPEHMERNVTEWQRLNPEWRAYLWTDQNIPVLRHSALYRRAKDLVPPDAVYQFQADIIRLELLYDFGGFYADTDTRPLKPIDSALYGHEVFAAMEDKNWVGNTVLGSVPGHPIFRDLVAGLASNVRQLRGKRPNHLSGPRYLTPIWKTHGGYTAPSHLFYPYSYRDVINGTIPDNLGDAYIEHQWHHTRTLLKTRGRTDV
jgi:mannosyltransferase OCH1-like enzyme